MKASFTVARKSIESLISDLNSNLSTLAFTFTFRKNTRHNPSVLLSLQRFSVTTAKHKQKSITTAIDEPRWCMVRLATQSLWQIVPKINNDCQSCFVSISWPAIVHFTIYSHPRYLKPLEAQPKNGLTITHIFVILVGECLVCVSPASRDVPVACSCIGEITLFCTPFFPTFRCLHYSSDLTLSLALFLFFLLE